MCTLPVSIHKEKAGGDVAQDDVGVAEVAEAAGLADLISAAALLGVAPPSSNKGPGLCTGPPRALARPGRYSTVTWA
jgi:hypothetical protein